MKQGRRKQKQDDLKGLGLEQANIGLVWQAQARRGSASYELFFKLAH
jgi:hypothetical protein